MNIDGRQFVVGGWEQFPHYLKHVWSLITYYHTWEADDAYMYLDVNGLPLRQFNETIGPDANLRVYNYTKPEQPFDWNRLTPSVPLPCHTAGSMNTVTFFRTSTHWVYIKECLLVGETNVIDQEPGRYSPLGPREVSFFSPMGTDYPSIFMTLKLSSQLEPPLNYIRQGLQSTHCPHIYLDVPSYSLAPSGGRYVYRDLC